MVSFFWLKPNHITCCLCETALFFAAAAAVAHFIHLCVVVCWFFFAIRFAMHFGGQQQRNRISCMCCMWIGSYYEISLALPTQCHITMCLLCIYIYILFCCCFIFFLQEIPTWFFVEHEFDFFLNCACCASVTPLNDPTVKKNINK